MTKQEALALAKTKWWERKTHREISEFQLFEDKLCCPFGIFHEAIEKTLGRSVYTHEFGLNADGLKKELMGEKESPSFQEILDLIPKDKQVIMLEV